MKYTRSPVTRGDLDDGTEVTLRKFAMILNQEVQSIHRRVAAIQTDLNRMKNGPKRDSKLVQQKEMQSPASWEV